MKRDIFGKFLNGLVLSLIVISSFGSGCTKSEKKAAPAPAPAPAPQTQNSNSGNKPVLEQAKGLGFYVSLSEMVVYNTLGQEVFKISLEDVFSPNPNDAKLNITDSFLVSDSYFAYPNVRTKSYHVVDQTGKEVFKVSQLPKKNDVALAGALFSYVDRSSTEAVRVVRNLISNAELLRIEMSKGYDFELRKELFQYEENGNCHVLNSSGAEVLLLANYCYRAALSNTRVVYEKTDPITSARSIHVIDSQGKETFKEENNILNLIRDASQSDSFFAYFGMEGTKRVFHVRNVNQEIAQLDGADLSVGYTGYSSTPTASDGVFAYQESSSGKYHVLNTAGQEINLPADLKIDDLAVYDAGFVITDDTDEKHFFDLTGKKTFQIKMDDILDLQGGKTSLQLGQHTFGFIESVAPFRFRVLDFSGKEILSAKDRIILGHRPF
jgi:hypothetical protein